jgi:amidophosphoribosyltransferase
VARLPHREGLIKSRYVGRTFIQPGQSGREEAVRMKFNPLPEVLRGKRVVVVDDSIVRGTTTGPIVAMLRRAGAREVHVRIHSPQMKFPCYMGVDTGRRSELIAATHSVEQIRVHIGADSLGYLSEAGLEAAVGRGEGRHCTACFNGRYPTDVPLDVDKFALERGSETWHAATARRASTSTRDGARSTSSLVRLPRRPTRPCWAGSAASARCSASTRPRIPIRCSSPRPTASARS